MADDPPKSIRATAVGLPWAGNPPTVSRVWCSST